MPAATLDLVAPAHRWCPPLDDTLGSEVADLCEAVGYRPDPEQRLVLDAAFGLRGHRPAVRDIGVVAPRQNLKTGLLKMMALGWPEDGWDMAATWGVWIGIILPLALAEAIIRSRRKG